MKKINFFIILCFSINLVFSQHNNFSNKSSSENNSYNWIVDYPDNIRLPFTNLEIQKLKYIYGDQLKKYVLDKPSRVKDIKHILRNRVVIQNEDVKDISNYPLLSTVSIFDVFNNSIQFPLFNKDNFNPLIYNFNFNSKTRLIYRVDNTNYLIVIKSKFN
ncbi:MAG: hypothetical protein HN660_01535 [Flavobacteriaceae bacterium]|jgi:hypothetical protein|nr:hypothetical protein [Flavobacteriaceae bacterium]